FAAGASAYGAAMFHLFTHAFFKALLFLGAGSVIHGLHDEQDMRKMGGIRKALPLTFILMWIGSLALAGIPLFAGYFSKDMVLESAFASGATFGTLAYGLGVLAALLTAFYSWRLLILTFDGKHRGDHHVIEHAHESPPVMLVPLFVLAAGALVAGYIGYPYFVGDLREAFWNGSIFVLHENDSVHKAHDVALWVKKLPLVMAVLGIALAYVFYRYSPGLPARVASKAGGFYRFLLNKWYWDELYARVFIRPSFAAGLAFWQRGDVGIIDRFGPDGVAALSGRASSALKRFQSGYMYHYAFAMFIGVTAAVTWFIMGGGQ
ncbi:MAG: proton-conducting transporter membrane subunit, partial [Holosporales bacterium]